LLFVCVPQKLCFWQFLAKNGDFCGWVSIFCENRVFADNILQQKVVTQK
jgi:hypothetical protein